MALIATNIILTHYITMSSTIRIERICQLCKNPFTAKTTVTRYCSPNCMKKAYKLRIKNAKIEKSNNETEILKPPELLKIKHKDFITVSEASVLLNISKRTIYRLVHSNTIPSFNFGDRLIRIKKSMIEKLFEIPPFDINKQNLKIEDCYYIGEVLNKFNIGQSTLQTIIINNNIPKIKKGRRTYIPKSIINKLFS